MQDQLDLIEGKVPVGVFCAVRRAYEQGVFTKPLSEMTAEEMKRGYNIGPRSMDLIRSAIGKKGYSSKELRLSAENRGLKRALLDRGIEIVELKNAQPILDIKGIYDRIRELRKFKGEIGKGKSAALIYFNNNDLVVKFGENEYTIHRWEYGDARRFCDALLQGINNAEEIERSIDETGKYKEIIDSIAQIRLVRES